jgi:hypothetical protein
MRIKPQTLGCWVGYWVRPVDEPSMAWMKYGIVG